MASSQNKPIVEIVLLKSNSYTVLIDFHSIFLKILDLHALKCKIFMRWTLNQLSYWDACVISFSPFQLPFPVVGSLNGVHMFAKNQDVSLLKTMTDDAIVVWKSFHDRLLALFIYKSPLAAVTCLDFLCQIQTHNSCEETTL